MRINKLFLVVLFASFGIHAWSQSWCPPGAEWAFYYTYTDLITSENRVGFLQSQYTGDEVVGGQVAQRISQDLYYGIDGGPQDQHDVLSPTYTRFSDGVVYIWTASNMQYDTLLWFSAELGDHWTAYSFDTQYQFFVTNVDVVDMDGVLVRKLTLSLMNTMNSSTVTTDVQYERVGLTNCFLFYPYNIMVSFQHFELRCYQDQEIDFSVFPDCGYPLSVAGREVNISPTIFPNPSGGRLRVEWSAHETFLLEVQDALGRSVHRESAQHASCNVDLFQLPPGLYNVLVTASDGARASAKWEKQ